MVHKTIKDAGKKIHSIAKDHKHVTIVSLIIQIIIGIYGIKLNIDYITGNYQPLRIRSSVGYCLEVCLEVLRQAIMLETALAVISTMLIILILIYLLVSYLHGKSKKKKRHSIWGIILGIIGGVITIAGVIYLLSIVVYSIKYIFGVLLYLANK